MLSTEYYLAPHKLSKTNKESYYRIPRVANGQQTIIRNELRQFSGPKNKAKLLIKVHEETKVGRIYENCAFIMRCTFSNRITRFNSTMRFGNFDQKFGGALQ